MRRLKPVLLTFFLVLCAILFNSLSEVPEVSPPDEPCVGVECLTPAPTSFPEGDSVGRLRYGPEIVAVVNLAAGS